MIGESIAWGDQALLEGLDRPTDAITVTDPRCNYMTARIADPSRLTQMRIGESIGFSYTEALVAFAGKGEAKKR